MNMHDLPPMVIHDLVQGTEAWAQFRLEHDGASEAAAMLGLSTTVKRSELLHTKHVGLPREFSRFVQERILDRGHEVEALARPLIEARIDDTLYPLTVSRGRLSASCDGLTFDNRIAFEHKQLAQELFLSVECGIVPDEHMPQCQQILLVTGAEKVLFVVSDGTEENMAVAEVFPDAAWFQRILSGWDQFHKDLAVYTPPKAAPVPVGKSPDTLPALLVQVNGSVTASNLEEFKSTALAAIRGVNRDLKSDQDFADADKAVKWCEDVEVRLKAAKEHALSQTASIDALFKAMDDIAGEARTVRLELDKLVTKRKQEVKEGIVQAAQRALLNHMAALDAELAPARLPGAAADFAGAVKGKRTLASVQDAVDLVLAQAKIAANEKAQATRANLATYRAEAAGMESLFPDLSTIAHKPADDFKTLVQARIAKHKADQEARERAIREQAERDAAAKLAREQEAAAKAQREAEANATAEAATRAAAETRAKFESEAQAPQQVLKATPATADATDRAAPAEASPGGGLMGVGQAAAAAPAGVTTGWAPGMLQDDSRGLSKALANTPGAMTLAREAAQAIGVDMARGESQTVLMTMHAGLLRDCHALTELLAQAFAGKFPSHPKPEKAWWDDVRARVAALQPALAAAVGKDVEA